MDGCIPQHMKRIRRWIQSDMSKRESKFSILINSKVGIFTCINLFIFHFVSSTTESLRSNHTNDSFWTKAHLRKLGSYKGLKVVQPMSQVSSSGGPMVTCRHTWPLWPGALWSRSAERRREQRVREGPVVWWWRQHSIIIGAAPSHVIITWWILGLCSMDIEECTVEQRLY